MDEETEQENDVCGGKVEGADHYLHSRPAFFRALQREGSPALIVKPRPTVGRFSGLWGAARSLQSHLLGRRRGRN